MAAWWLGWAGWAAAILQARDWDEVRLGAFGNLFITVVHDRLRLVFLPYFNHTHPTVRPYVIGMAALSLGLLFFIWQHERRRRALAAVEKRPEIEAHPSPG